jgi:hypothetical protein
MVKRMAIFWRCKTLAQGPNDATMDQGAPLPRAGLRLLAAWLLAAGMVVAAVLPVIAIVNLDSPIDLSKRAKASIKSAYPDVEASMDGKYVAVVWSRGYNSASETKDYGYIILKSARPDPDGWENQIKVFTPTDSFWGVGPRAVFDPVDSGKLYVTWVGCDVTRPDPDIVSFQCDTIMAATCTLTGTDRCSPAETVYSQTTGSLSTPDIAADKAGQLHVVWKNGTTGAQGIQYKRKSGGSWDSLSLGYVSLGANFYSPALAWANDGSTYGRLHLAWYQFDSNEDSRFIEYRACAPDPATHSWGSSDPSSSEWKAPKSMGYKFTGDTGEPTIKPSLAASGTTVVLAWDVSYKADPNKFHLAYNYSATSGDTWIASGPYGLGLPDGDFSSITNTYLSPINNIDEEDALRPSIAITGTAPVVTWHYSGTVEEGVLLKHVQLVGYREASDALTWGDPTIIDQNLNYDGDQYPYDDSADPDLAIAPLSGVHLVYMGMWGRGSIENRDWDIYYRGDITVDNSTDDAGGAYLPVILKNR